MRIIEGSPEELHEFLGRKIEKISDVIPVSHVRHRRIRKYKHYKPSEIRKAWKMNAEGIGIPKISRELHRPITGIKNLLYRIEKGIVKVKQ